MSTETYTVTVDSHKTVRFFKPNTDILHRLDGPAVERANGSKEWYKDGKRHRLDGPAVEYVNGDKAWWVDGKRHRLDGPAIERADGSKDWCVDGNLHRLDGPAVEYVNGSKEWWVDGKEFTEAKFKEITGKKADPCDGKTVEIDGKKYKLVAL